MNVVFDQFRGDRDWKYFSAGTKGWKACEDTCGLTAFDEETGDILAVWVLDRFTKTTALGHGVMTDSIVMKHGWMEECAGFNFDHHKLTKVILQIPQSTQKIHSFVDWVGFTEIARIPEAYDVNDDIVIYEMSREDCRFLPENQLRASGE